MLHVSRFTPDPARYGEWIAALWNGPVPDDLVLQRWIYLRTEPRQIEMIWEASTPDAVAFVERALGEFGRLETVEADDNTPGMAAALARDLDAFRRSMLQRGAAEAHVEVQLDLRRRGFEAADRDAAMEAGRRWAGEQRS